MTSYLLVYDFFDENQNLCEVTSFLRMCDVLLGKTQKIKMLAMKYLSMGGRYSTEVALALPTQMLCIQIS